MIMSPLYWLLIRCQRVRNYRRVFLCACIVMVCACAWLSKPRPQTINVPIKLRYIEDQLRESVLRDKGSGCQIPELDPFAEQVMKFVKDLPKISCQGEDWVECYEGKCAVTENILRTKSNVSCSYSDLIYVNDKEYDFDTPERRVGDQVYWLNRSDHVKISCTAQPAGLKFINQLVPERWFGYKGALRPLRARPSPQDTPDILVIGFDSVSRAGFIRKMPKSYDFLTKDLNAIVMKGYNIVGDGTTAALFPLLTGKSENENLDPTLTTYVENTFDPKNFIFHTLKEQGYRTAYFENMPFIGTFTLSYSGFRSQPTDHYLYPLLMEQSKYGLRWWKGLQQRYCFGSTPEYLYLLNLTEQLLKTEGKHFCFTFVTDVSHNDFNLISTVEDDLVDFLRRLRDSNALANTMLVVMGDHGIRFNTELRATYQGKLEERLPFLSIVLPETLKRRRTEAERNLRANANVLTTVYDVYTTFLDVAGLGWKRNKYKVAGTNLFRGLSLLEPIPSSRTCGEAGIVPHYCACTRWLPLNVSDPLVQAAAQTLLQKINSLTLQLRAICRQWELVSVNWGMVNTPNKGIFKNYRNTFFGLGNSVETVRSQSEYYQVQITVNPGQAMFEASMTYNVDQKVFSLTDTDISRINMYGDQPNCIKETHPRLRKYCYCYDYEHHTSPEPDSP